MAVMALPYLCAADAVSPLVIGPCFLYVFYGMYDAVFQSLCYWAMGALSNDPATMYAYLNHSGDIASNMCRSARYVALYKASQATGGAMAWRIVSFFFILFHRYVSCASDNRFSDRML